MNKNISQCQTDLSESGFCITKIELPNIVREAVIAKDYEQLDKIISTQCIENGAIFELMKQFCSVEKIEHIISLRESINDWEEDGIWHDDGSRIMAFSLSLTFDKPEGGVLEFRKKGVIQSHKIPTPKFSEIIIFKTGVEDYEHKINAVTKGSRLIIAGWCYPSKSTSTL